MSQKKRRFQVGEYDLDLTYITPRIIAMGASPNSHGFALPPVLQIMQGISWLVFARFSRTVVISYRIAGCCERVASGFPSSGTEGIYRNPLPEVQAFFTEFHPRKYMIFNLCSEREYPAEEFEGRVQRFAFDDHNPCPLTMISDFCRAVDAWLTADKDNVVAVHCKAGKGRTGLMVAAYLLHSGFKPTAQRALSYFGDARTANAQGVTIPSQMRYVHYYEHQLRHGAAPRQVFRITHVRVLTVPNIEIVSGVWHTGLMLCCQSCVN